MRSKAAENLVKGEVFWMESGDERTVISIWYGGRRGLWIEYSSPDGSKHKVNVNPNRRVDL